MTPRPRPLIADRDALAEALMSALCESVIWEDRHVGELEEHLCDTLADALLASPVLTSPAEFVAALAEDEAVVGQVAANCTLASDSLGIDPEDVSGIITALAAALAAPTTEEP